MDAPEDDAVSVIEPPCTDTNKLACGRFTEMGFEWIPKKNKLAKGKFDVLYGRKQLVTRVG